MCSNIDSEDLPDLIPKLAPFDRKTNRTCRRCPNEPVVLLQKKDPFCRTCFLGYCSHKFRSTLGKYTHRNHSTNVVKRTERVLIAFSGGASSSALVDLIAQESDESKAYKRMPLQPSILFVDESDLIVSDDAGKVDEIVKRMNQTGWPAYYTALKMATNKDNDFYVDAGNASELQRIRQISDKSCVNCITQLKSLTAKEELIRRLRIQLIVDVAQSEGFDSVFLGSNATRLSIQLITDVAQGKGNQIHLETGFSDDRFSSVRILKPLREFVSKEITFYNRMRNIEFDQSTELGTKLPAKASLGKLSEAFINGLQTDFPATVYTLFKIAEKVKSTFSAVIKCDLCGTGIDACVSDNGDCSAQAALLLSQRLSRSKAADDGHGGGSLTTGPTLCYGCTLIANELPSSADMPEKIVRTAATKQSIQQFLIADDGDN